MKLLEAHRCWGDGARTVRRQGPTQLYTHEIDLVALKVALNGLRWSDEGGQATRRLEVGEEYMAWVSCSELARVEIEAFQACHSQLTGALKTKCAIAATLLDHKQDAPSLILDLILTCDRWYDLLVTLGESPTLASHHPRFSSGRSGTSRAVTHPSVQMLT